MLDDHVVILLIVVNAQFVEEVMCRFPHYLFEIYEVNFRLFTYLEHINYANELLLKRSASPSCKKHYLNN